MKIKNYMKRNCKNCKQECISIYCSDECNKQYKSIHSYIIKKCLTCGAEFRTRISIPKKYCSLKCSSSNVENIKQKNISYKNTCMDKYGVDNISKLKETSEKIKATNIERYGTDSYSKTKQFISDFKSTCMDKYGVEYPQQSESIREKSKNTVIKKYGGFTLKSPKLRKKAMLTMEKRYGNISPLKCYELKMKQQMTNIERYGDITPLTNENVKMKTSNTLMEKYGIENISQMPEVKLKVKHTNHEIYINSLFDGTRLNNMVAPMFKREEYINNSYSNKYKFSCNKCKTEFEDNLYSGHIPRCPTCYPLHISKQQLEIYEYLKSIVPVDTEVIQNKRDILKSGLELDIYIQKLNVAIEYNGLYWHSEFTGGKKKTYHLNKTLECEKQGIRLIHIFEDEWINNRSVVERRLKHILRLNTSDKIYARKCEIKEVTSTITTEFLNKYHIQGRDNASVRFGAYYDNELVSVMTLGKRRIAMGIKVSGEGEYELLRFCSGEKMVIGIAGKLFNAFLKKYDPTKITTYGDRRYSNADIFYNKIGFVYTGETAPNYWYFKIGDIHRRHRFNFRKNELPKKLATFDPNLTEWQNMQLNGYDRIWDCGNFKYEWIKK